MSGGLPGQCAWVGGCDVMCNAILCVCVPSINVCLWSELMGQTYCEHLGSFRKHTS